MVASGIDRRQTAPAVPPLPFSIHFLAADGASFPAGFHRVTATPAFLFQHMLTERTDRELQVHHALAVAAELFFAFLGENGALNFRHCGLPFEDSALGKVGHKQHPSALCEMADGVG